MENIIKAFDEELNRYDAILRKISRLNTEISITEEEIEDIIPCKIRSLQAALDRLPKYKANLERELEETLQNAIDVHDSWYGTYIKDDDPDDVEVFERRNRRNAHKMQMPCSNHTYKDLRFKDKVLRKVAKKTRQTEIQTVYAKSFRCGYPGKFTMYDGDYYIW